MFFYDSASGMKVFAEKYEKRCHQVLSNDDISKKHMNFWECDKNIEGVINIAVMNDDYRLG